LWPLHLGGYSPSSGCEAALGWAPGGLPISNLIENGIKYCGIGQTVRVDVSRKVDLAVLRVSDTGPGIPAEHLPLLFDRFYRADSRAITQRQGTAVVSSKINEGTTVAVTLPLAQPSIRAR